MTRLLQTLSPKSFTVSPRPKSIQSEMLAVILLFPLVVWPREQGWSCNLKLINSLGDYEIPLDCP